MSNMQGQTILKIELHADIARLTRPDGSPYYQVMIIGGGEIAGANSWDGTYSEMRLFEEYDTPEQALRAFSGLRLGDPNEPASFEAFQEQDSRKSQRIENLKNDSWIGKKPVVLTAYEAYQLLGNFDKIGFMDFTLYMPHWDGDRPLGYTPFDFTVETFPPPYEIELEDGKKHNLKLDDLILLQVGTGE